jgi:hypothetical protein
VWGLGSAFSENLSVVLLITFEEFWLDLVFCESFLHFWRLLWPWASIVSGFGL